VLEVVYTHQCTEMEVRRCRTFAELVTPTSLKHKQTHDNVTEQRFIEQQITSKLGELAVAAYFKSVGFFASEPDFTIYEAPPKNKPAKREERRFKSYDADLMLPGSTGIHVKTQDTRVARRIGQSWVFMKRDPITREINHDLAAFCSFNPNRGKPFVQLLSLVPTRELVERKLFKDTVAQNNAWKCAVYREDLLNIPNVDTVSYVSQYRMNA